MYDEKPQTLKISRIVINIKRRRLVNTLKPSRYYLFEFDFRNRNKYCSYFNCNVPCIASLEYIYNSTIYSKIVLIELQAHKKWLII